MQKTIQILTCPNCKHEWIPRKLAPENKLIDSQTERKCPKCQRKFELQEVEK